MPDSDQARLPHPLVPDALASHIPDASTVRPLGVPRREASQPSSAGLTPPGAEAARAHARRSVPPCRSARPSFPMTCFVTGLTLPECGCALCACDLMIAHGISPAESMVALARRLAEAADFDYEAAA